MAGRNRNIQQIRFINGEEVLANIVHWEEDSFIEMNNALSMIPIESDVDDGRAFYMLKPLVSYTDDLGQSITVNPGSIMCMCEPSPTVMEQYTSSLRDILHQLEDDAEVRQKSGKVVSIDTKRKLLTEEDESL